MASLHPDPAPDWKSVATQIHASGRQLVIAVTGGGSGALSALLQTPGASRTMLAAIVPYSLAALVDWIGGKPDQACSEATARAMAMAAFMRARELAPESNACALIGVGCTASLATDRPKRGERRLHVAVQNASATSVHSLTLLDATPTRAEDEVTATTFLLSVIAAACGVDATPLRQRLPAELRTDECVARIEESQLLLGTRRVAIVPPGSNLDRSAATAPSQLPVIFAGAFNPLHAGHLGMAAIAEQRLQRPVAWELSIANVDKPPLDFIAIRDRVADLRREDPDRPIALTQSPTFREKSELFPGATFVVGVDTLLRIAKPRYYDGDVARRDAAVAEIASRGCRFLTFGRMIEGRFTTLGGLELPPALLAICDEIIAEEFREDVSSTQLRQLAPGQ